MPIRFRCAYCNQLMGIARRKAGTVVRCPTCGGQVVVPQPHQAKSAGNPAPAAAGDVFDQADFDAAFQQPSNGASARSNAAAPRVSPAPAPRPTGNFDVEPVYYHGPGDDAPAGFVLSPAKMILLGAIMLMLLALSFLGGLLIGQSTAAFK
jgi:hypothetical protein